MSLQTYKAAPPMSSAKLILPAITGPDSGIIVAKTLLKSGPRYKLWYYLGGQRKYVSLPLGTTHEGARTRRDHLHKNLKKLHGAKATKRLARTPRRKEHTVSLKPGMYIYERPPFFVKILGKQIGTARTREEAQTLLDNWVAANPDKVEIS